MLLISPPQASCLSHDGRVSLRAHIVLDDLTQMPLKTIKAAGKRTVRSNDMKLIEHDVDQQL